MGPMSVDWMEGGIKAVFVRLLPFGLHSACSGIQPRVLPVAFLPDHAWRVCFSGFFGITQHL